ncbi:MAG: hypothetical protein DRN03_05840 [Thermoplasmata archaeon]|nr:MAG: hypothetical protein DRN03_05840 [Thermoplasmata archaeon]
MSEPENSRSAKFYFLLSKDYPDIWEPERVGRLKYMYIKERLDVLNRIRPKGKIIADMGAGKGRYAIPLALMGLNAVIACDISSAMLHILNKRAKENRLMGRILTVQADCEQLPFRSSIFDVVICIDTFHYFLRPMNALKEFVRVLKNEGIMMINVPNKKPIGFFSKIQLMLAKTDKIGTFIANIYYSLPLYPVRLILHRALGWPHKRTKRKPTVLGRGYTKNEFINLLSSCGLKVEEILEYGGKVPIHFLAVCRKAEA